MWKFSTGLGLDYNDNVNYTQENPEGDFIFRPQMNVQMLLPVSDQNSLSLALGAGYSAYVQHPELNRTFITPNTGLSFDLYVGDFWINLHNRISITEDTYQDPSVAGTGGYSQLQNSLGLATSLGFEQDNPAVRIRPCELRFANQRQRSKLRGSTERVLRGFLRVGGLRLETGQVARRGAGRVAYHLHNAHREHAL